MKIHFMKLQNKPFQSIYNGQKTIEMRLFDKKRKAIKRGDQIEFTNISTGDTIVAEVVQIHKFDSFEELYRNFNKERLGYSKSEIASPTDMEKYYPQEEIKKYGVVGIEIKLL